MTNFKNFVKIWFNNLPNETKEAIESTLFNCVIIMMLFGLSISAFIILEIPSKVLKSSAVLKNLSWLYVAGFIAFWFWVYAGVAITNIRQKWQEFKQSDEYIPDNSGHKKKLNTLPDDFFYMDESEETNTKVKQDKERAIHLIQTVVNSNISKTANGIEMRTK